MYISDVHDYSEQPLPEVAQEFLSQGAKKQLKSVIEGIVEEEFDRLREYASEFLSQTAASRAEAFLERVLNGDDDAAMALLGNKLGGDRCKKFGSDEGQPWVHLIHGKLFETGGIALRRKIVEAHPELLRNERIADLESVVDGLTQQVRKLEADLAECRERY